MNVVRQLTQAGKGRARFAIVLALLTASLAILTAYPSQGAVPSLDQIRVAIFIDHTRYSLKAPLVTLSAAGGMSVGVRETGGAESWFAVGANQQARFGLDDYKVLLAESGDLRAAANVLGRVQAAGSSAVIHAVRKSGKQMYQVIEGSYATVAEATSGAARWGQDATLKGLTGADRYSLLGPLRLESEAMASLDEARGAVQAYEAAGFSAYVAARGKGVYSVMVGAAADQAALEALRANLAKEAPIAALDAADTSKPYLLMMTDHAITQSAQASTVAYLAGGSGTKAWVTPVDSNGIKLNERYNRLYRGNFEISSYNNRLAVINELPFEQYLYAVVGGEMPGSWHAEALKAQAVAARTYALYQGFGFGIAHVVDTTLSQVYGGIGAEKPSTVAAVDATKGEVALFNGKLIEALFSSNSGGATAEASEVWGNAVAYLTSVPSPDQLAENGLYYWYRVALPSGQVGYIREDLVEPISGKSPAGSDRMQVNTDGTNVRPAPLVQSDVSPVAQANRGTVVTVLEKVVQSNEMSWVRGPFTAAAVQATLKARGLEVSGTLQTLEVSKRGQSGRAVELAANGQTLAPRSPDSFRSALGGLPSTRFEIDETGRVAIAAASGETRDTGTDAGALHVLGANGTTGQLSSGNLFIMNGDGEIRVATAERQFRFVGTGYGHGLGLSQYGARGLAEQGYGYDYILKYYYNGITIAKA